MASWLLQCALTHILWYPKGNKLQREEIEKNSKSVKEGVDDDEEEVEKLISGGFEFRMPLHYPKYSKAEYEKMEEWKLDMLLGEYGLLLCFKGTLEEKRAYAKGAFLWPDQL